MVKKLAFELVVKVGVAMLYVKWPMIRQQKDQWRVV